MVSVPRGIATQRLLKRNPTLSQEDAERRIASQLTNAERYQSCHVLLSNHEDKDSTSPDALPHQLERAWRHLMSRVEADPDAGSVQREWRSNGGDAEAWRGLLDAKPAEARHEFLRVAEATLDCLESWRPDPNADSGSLRSLTLALIRLPHPHWAASSHGSLGVPALLSTSHRG